MANKYVDFISDAHLLKCIGNLFQAYTKAQQAIDLHKFYSNKIDIFKLTFDSHFNNVSPETVLQSEIIRQSDKSVNNSIGTFHEEILGGIKGYEKGNKSGYDIKAVNNTLFADIKNKHNTMNSSASESLFIKLKDLADKHKTAKCYWVQILAKDSFCSLWEGDINGKECRHSRVYKISGDRFYALLTGKESALYDLYKALPDAINDYKSTLPAQLSDTATANSSIESIIKSMQQSGLSTINQVAKDNFNYYSGFDSL